MIKLRERRDPNGADEYFLREVRLREEEKRGVWIGATAQILGIHERAITSEALVAAMGGFVPDGECRGWPLGARMKAGAMGAIEAVFSVDKSVSVVALAGGQVGDRAVQACRQAVMRTVTGWEQFAYCTRGSGRDRTANVLAGLWMHHSSRHGDPHLHAHVLFMNGTWHSEERRFFRVQSRWLFGGARAMDRAFQAELVRELRGEGFPCSLEQVEHVTAARISDVDLRLCRRLSVGGARLRAAAGTRARPAGMAEGRWRNLAGDRIRPPKPPTPDFASMLSGLVSAEVRAPQVAKAITARAAQLRIAAQPTRTLYDALRLVGCVVERSVERCVEEVAKAVARGMAWWRPAPGSPGVDSRRQVRPRARIPAPSKARLRN